jgi:hypothetical protein
MEIPEVESPGGGSVRYDIRKDAVDTIFDQYLQNLAANNLPPLKWRFDNSLRYRLFSEDLTAQLVSNPTAVPVVVSTNSNNIGGNFPTPSVAPTPKSVPNDNELRRRMSVYMRNCQIVGMVPTLKQVQSAIKRKHSTGLTVKEIYNMATSMGFVVR